MIAAGVGVTERFEQVNGIRLHIAESGHGKPVLLLHGFPEFWYSWRHQLPALSHAGFRAIAPDLRGYNESERPTSVVCYRTKTLVTDIVKLIEELKCGPVYLVGHDWGGLIAWRLAASHSHLVRKLIVLNAAHPAAFRRELRRNWRQWIKSHYVLFFQLPWLPERMIRAKDFALLERGWRTQPVNPDAFTGTDIQEYKQAFEKGISGPLNYYRAAFRFSSDLFGSPQIVSVPTLVIWGAQDTFMSASVNDYLHHWVPTLVVKTIPDASHWVQNDVPEKVNTLLIDFLTGNVRRLVW
jgi:pimeloyl-ACP methyl ester carboxylesterase